MGNSTVIHFDTGEGALTSAARESAWAKLPHEIKLALFDPKKTVVVEGHASRVSDSSSNRALSQSRAADVSELLKDHGASAKLLTIGTGEDLAREQGKADGTNDAENRSVIIHILDDTTEDSTDTSIIEALNDAKSYANDLYEQNLKSVEDEVNTPQVQTDDSTFGMVRSYVVSLDTDRLDHRDLNTKDILFATYRQLVLNKQHGLIYPDLGFYKTFTQHFEQSGGRLNHGTLEQVEQAKANGESIDFHIPKDSFDSFYADFLQLNHELVEARIEELKELHSRDYAGDALKDIYTVALPNGLFRAWNGLVSLPSDIYNLTTYATGFDKIKPDEALTIETRLEYQSEFARSGRLGPSFMSGAEAGFEISALVLVGRLQGALEATALSNSAKGEIVHGFFSSMSKLELAVDIHDGAQIIKSIIENGFTSETFDQLFTLTMQLGMGKSLGDLHVNNSGETGNTLETINRNGDPPNRTQDSEGGNQGDALDQSGEVEIDRAISDQFPEPKIDGSGDGGNVNTDRSVKDFDQFLEEIQAEDTELVGQPKLESDNWRETHGSNKTDSFGAQVKDGDRLETDLQVQEYRDASRLAEVREIKGQGFEALHFLSQALSRANPDTLISVRDALTATFPKPYNDVVDALWKSELSRIRNDPDLLNSMTVLDWLMLIDDCWKNIDNQTLENLGLPKLDAKQIGVMQEILFLDMVVRSGRQLTDIISLNAPTRKRPSNSKNQNETNGSDNSEVANGNETDSDKPEDMGGEEETTEDSAGEADSDKPGYMGGEEESLDSSAGEADSDEPGDMGGEEEATEDSAGEADSDEPGDMGGKEESSDSSAGEADSDEPAGFGGASDAHESSTEPAHDTNPEMVGPE